MIHKKLLSLLVLLMTVASGAWAQDHEYVDLGLPSGTLWATCNVGADSPEQYGGYFAFGEVETKSSYSPDNYKWASNPHEANTFTKYNHVDNLTVLQPEDDAATVNWGVQWRMPTVAEVVELIANCEITSTTLNNKTGYLYTSKINGKTIFFPHAGYYDDNDLHFYGAGERAYLWTASVYENLGGMMFYNWYSVDGYCTKAASAGCGMTVRPVFNKDAVPVTTNKAQGETTFTQATFAMPASDATVGFDIVRDMNDATYPVEFAGIPEPTTGGVSKIVVKKNSTSGKFEFLNPMTIQLIDNISGTDVDIIEATGITIKVLKGTENSYGAIEYDQENPIKLSEFLENTEPGYYWIKAVPTDETTSPYIGTVYSYEMLLIKGYEVEVPADEFITYYKDENLTLEETENNAQLYTITSIGESTATATELSVAAANTPLLVKNNSNATKTILLIPTDDQADDVTAYRGFVGTLEATIIAASTNSQNNYAMNGKEFIWVRTAIPVAANKAWLAVPVSSGNSANIRIVFDNDEATEIEGVDSGELTVDSDDAWYDLSGRKLDGQPTTKGVYIWKGKKVVVK